MQLPNLENVDIISRIRYTLTNHKRGLNEVHLTNCVMRAGHSKNVHEHLFDDLISHLVVKIL